MASLSKVENGAERKENSKYNFKSEPGKVLESKYMDRKHKGSPDI